MNEPRYVYLMRLGAYHKIGQSRNPHQRRVTLAGAEVPEIVHLIASKRACKVENALHRRFAAGHVRGEWFSLTSEDVALIVAVSECDSPGDLPPSLRPEQPARRKGPAVATGPAAACSVGPTITRLRESAGWSRYRLAKTAGVDAAFLMRLERGAGQPSLPVARKLARALGVSLSVFDAVEG